MLRVVGKDLDGDCRGLVHSALSEFLKTTTNLSHLTFLRQ
jgi:hypothetical protein